MTVCCTWCEIELAPGDAKPILYARLPELPDEENMQCRDFEACKQRQKALSSPLRGRSPLFGEAGDA